jgi:hypothetical protein
MRGATAQGHCEPMTRANVRFIPKTVSFVFATASSLEEAQVKRLICVTGFGAGDRQPIKNQVDSVDSVDAFAARVDAHRAGESE